ncbi:peptidase T [Shewanella fidelis]|uniref:Peptidase T n=1 Tax=Shewanella fidelis TaxID=173509 RepID=A0AAW8NLC6_9GAMM|nr:peptidase T [Shewanella fidelis]MDR8523016.1 peptidase T [Shewanella fidelis]MDW4811658.1 peptidase T [Shewanella fidelis]MDW4815779.1 peptidase T [Shewanella fidelis]MDW4819869.1 peptidase T [Shewanella fidelis]MDW4824157.1 peptidase T [Shewanella fidelis]
MKQQLLERFLRYVSFNTQSDGSSQSVPSTDNQFVFAQHLRQELISLGFEEVKLSDKGYLTATVPGNVTDAPCIGFIAHLDTAPDFSGANVNPQIIENYNGKDIQLGLEEVLSPSQFNSLNQYQGQTLITTDGTSLLGGDDKAGIAEIICALHHLLTHPEIPHGKIRLCFTPDEEIGRGADHFDVESFGAQWAYTVDGGQLGELEYENFNAATAVITATGNNCHPGTAYGVMVNAQTIAARFHAKMPLKDTPECSKDYDGFFHLMSMEGVTEKATLTYIIRDFDLDLFEQRKRWLADLVSKYNAELSIGQLTIDIQDSYLNMKQQVLPHPHIIDIAKQAMQNLNIEPIVKPIRGGTDGSRLSYMGLPCPNIFTGGHNFHGKHEYVCLESMEQACQTIIEIAKLTAKHK